jgi:surfactin synthase thioesterase subunit
VRTTGAPATSVEALVALYQEALPPALLDAVMVGHSLGGYVALALCRALPARARGLVVAASTPPQARLPDFAPSRFDDRTLVSWLQEIGGDAPALQDPETFPIFAPSLRADLAAYETFTVQPPLPSQPALLCGGEMDPLCTPVRFARWRELLPAAELLSLPGGHFFPQTDPAPFAAAVRRFVADLPGS